MISIIESSEADNCWNQRLLDSKLGQSYQTKEFGLSKKLLNGETLFLKFISSNGSIVGQLLVMLYSGVNEKFSLKKLGKKFLNKNYVFARWVHGPIIFDLNYKNEIILKFQEYLKSKKFKVWGSDYPLQLTLSQNTKNFSTDQWATFLIDLNNSKEALWNNLEKHSARKNIERSRKRNVIVKQMSRSDLSVYYELIQQSKKTEPELTLSFLEKQWDVLQPINFIGFIAYENNIPVGAIRASSFNGYINEFSVIRTVKDTMDKLYSQDLLKWNIIEWGLKNHFSYYDLSGVNPYPNNSKEEGIFRYKQKWGGNLIKYNILTS